MATISIFNNSNFVKISNDVVKSKSNNIRSVISTFSKQSRKRLIDTAQQINQRKILQNPIFITLTYPSVFPTSHSICKRHLDSFSKRLNRLFSNFFVIWRLEYQNEKGTKRGAPHYHLILFFCSSNSRVCNIKRFQKWLSLAWFQVVGSGDTKHLAAGTQAQRMRSWRGVIAYVSKYMAKVNQSGIPDVMDDLPGRFWGIFGRSSMPVDKTEFFIPDDVFYSIRRIFRKVYETKRRHKYRFTNNTFGMSLYLDSRTSYDIFNFIVSDFNNPNFLERKLP
jgi:hypothetical protein